MPERRIQNQTLSHCSGCRAEWEEFDRFYSSVDEFVLISSATSAFTLASNTVTSLLFIQTQLLQCNLFETCRLGGNISSYSNLKNRVRTHSHPQFQQQLIRSSSFSVTIFRLARTQTAASTAVGSSIVR